MHVQLDPVRHVAPAQRQQVTEMGPDMSAAPQAPDGSICAAGCWQTAQLAYAREHALRMSYATAVPQVACAAAPTTTVLAAPPTMVQGAQIATAAPNRWNRRAKIA